MEYLENLENILKGVTIVVCLTLYVYLGIYAYFSLLFVIYLHTVFQLKKHPLLFSSISPRKMIRFVQKFQ